MGDVHRRLAFMRGLNTIITNLAGEAAAMVMPMYIAAIYSSDGTSLHPMFTLASAKNEICHSWTRLAYLTPGSLVPLLKHVAASAPATLKDHVDMSFTKIVEQYVT